MLERVTGRAARPEKTDGSARSSWGLEPRKRESQQGLLRCMYPGGWLPRKSWQLEHNQGRSPFKFSVPLPESSLPRLKFFSLVCSPAQWFSTVLWKRTRDIRGSAREMRVCGVCPKNGQAAAARGGKGEFCCRFPWQVCEAGRKEVAEQTAQVRVLLRRLLWSHIPYCGHVKLTSRAAYNSFF